MKEELKLSGKTKEDKHMRGTVTWYSRKKGYDYRFCEYWSGKWCE